MRSIRIIVGLFLMIFSVIVAAVAYAGEIIGAGATFPQPIYLKWASDFKKETNNIVNYQGVGSGAGIKQIDARTVIFGATDIPLKPEDLEKKGQVQFPMIVGGIVPIYNLKDITTLTLTVDVVAKIYSNKITRWNDKELQDLNPNVKLPDIPIIKVRRSDGSGTTYNFTKYLSEANADWKKDYGFGPTVEWSGNAIGAKGNDGVANNVQQTNGSIGYVEYAFAKTNNLSSAEMIGTDGKKVVAGLAAFQSNWPMVAISYIVMYRENEEKEAAKLAVKFFEYGLSHDTEAMTMDYVPLTETQKKETRKTLSQIK